MTRFVRGLKHTKVQIYMILSSTMTRFVRGLKRTWATPLTRSSSTMTRFVRGLKLKTSIVKACLVLL